MSPGQLDAAVVRRHLLALDEAVQRLRRHAGRPLSALAADLDAQWAVERGLQLCAQNAIDIATHLAASAGRDTPDYASAIDVLGEVGVLPAEFARRFRGVAGFRNVLVHGYLRVDLGRVHDLLNSGLDGFAEFARHVEAFLQRG
ncbi:MAG: type VII toxin-antitoxin system HepT family RNase toxin [Candidatus Rokuibacteriota bacterium]